MSALWQELVVIGVSLLIAAGAVFGLGDRAVLVPPPEMVVEEFVRKLALARWDPAREHLTEELAVQMNADSLRAFLITLEHRVGTIEDVEGEPFFMVGRKAEAIAQIRAIDGYRAALRLSLLRENGLWKISRLGTDELILGHLQPKPADRARLRGLVERRGGGGPVPLRGALLRRAFGPMR